MYELSPWPTQDRPASVYLDLVYRPILRAWVQCTSIDLVFLPPCCRAGGSLHAALLESAYVIKSTYTPNTSALSRTYSLRFSK